MKASRGIVALMMVLLISVFVPASAASAPTSIGLPFRDYYAEHQGWRVLGAPITDMVQVDGQPAQYFEKGRIEDHRSATADPHWAFMYGRLTAELMQRTPSYPVNATSITYGDLERAAQPSRRHPAPRGLTSGTTEVRDGIFIPFDPQLRASSGYVVPLYFWNYINQAGLFPGGWLHDIGLPMTDAFLVNTVKNGEQRQIMMQAFERTVLTYDPRNPLDWQVERGNIGSDALSASAVSNPIELPAPDARVSLPLHVVAQVGQPNEAMTMTLRWANGVKLSRTVTTLRSPQGEGLLIASLGWQTESRPPQPAARAATLEIRDAAGMLQAQQSLEVLRWDDADTQPVTLYWLLGDGMRGGQRNVPRTMRIGTAALEELIWGPGPPNFAGFRTAIPGPAEVLAYPGRTTDWGPRVTLRKLTITNGVATADFSRELAAYGDDPVRAGQIREQVRRTLQEFPSVQDVRITVEGVIDPALAP